MGRRPLIDRYRAEWNDPPRRELLSGVLSHCFECQTKNQMSWPHSARPVVLIVEDEPMVRSFAVDMVQEAGFEVIAAANADDAIRILETNSAIRVVFTDIHMPGSMDGLKLAHAVRNRWPPIKIIVTSGQRMTPENELPEGGRFFAKPYNPSQIQGVLREWAGQSIQP